DLPAGHVTDPAPLAPAPADRGPHVAARRAVAPVAGGKLPAGALDDRALPSYRAAAGQAVRGDTAATADGHRPGPPLLPGHRRGMVEPATDPRGAGHAPVRHAPREPAWGAAWESWQWRPGATATADAVLHRGDGAPLSTTCPARYTPPAPL